MKCAALAVLVGVLGWVNCAVGAEWQIRSSKPFQSDDPSTRSHEVVVSNGDQTFRVWSVVFSESDVTVRVLPIGPGGPASIGRLAKALGAVAAINASYFTEDHSPLGLVISDGATLQGPRKARLLSGIFDVRSGRMELLRSSHFKASDVISQAVQAGPWLVDDGQTVPGLEATRRARRSVLATDRRGGWALVSLSPVTLADAGKLLLADGVVPGLAIHAALNLDGGSSSALWAATEPVLSIPEFVRVSNGIFVFPKGGEKKSEK